jgi:TM2 domain-containing membrane protein YozV
MFCANCGTEIDDKAVICVKCGVATNSSDSSSNVFGETPKQGFDWLTTLLLCWFLGYLGVHSFYTKKTGIGVAQLLTAGGCGIWTLIDLITIFMGTFRDGNGNLLVKK